MSKYLLTGSYAAEGARGRQKSGGSKRRTAFRELIEKAGGKLESFHFAFGDSDLYAVVDLPDSAMATAISLAVNQSGAVSLRTVPLLTPEELDAATRKPVDYRPPGAQGLRPFACV